MRRVLVFVAMLAGLAAASAASSAARTQDASPAASPAIGDFEATIDIGGRGLRLACVGAGSPTVLFESGGPNPDGGAVAVAEVGAFVADALGTRFCSYDRAGTGGSDSDPIGVRTFRQSAADLIAVLASPELACPCVVIGESLGGAIALVALADDPSGFAGLVLLDAPYPGYFDEFVALAPADSPEAALEAELASGDNPEQLDMAAGFRQVAVPAEPPAIPVVVVTHGAGDPPPCFPCSEGYPVAELEATWQTGQADLARALGGQLVVAEGTDHFIAEADPGLVINVTAEVIAAVRDPSTWATPAATPGP